MNNTDNRYLVTLHHDADGEPAIKSYSYIHDDLVQQYIDVSNEYSMINDYISRGYTVYKPWTNHMIEDRQRLGDRKNELFAKLEYVGILNGKYDNRTSWNILSAKQLQSLTRK